MANNKTSSNMVAFLRRIVGSRYQISTGFQPLHFSNRLEMLEARRHLDGKPPAIPQLAVDKTSFAVYDKANTYFAWQDIASVNPAYDPATEYVIQTSVDGSGGWTSFPPVGAGVAKQKADAFIFKKTTVVVEDEEVEIQTNRVKGYRHDRQKFYRIFAVDGQGDTSKPTGSFKVVEHPEDFVFKVSVTPQPLGGIALSWRAMPGFLYSVLRRKAGSTDVFDHLTEPALTFNDAVGGHVDSTAVAGLTYEYQIVESEPGFDFQGNYEETETARGRLLAGNASAAVEQRGKIVLLIDDAVAGALRGHIARLQSDLTGDGWTVSRHNVYRNQPVTAVKDIIENEYEDALLPSGQSEVKQVLLLGHVPVPYSGDYAPDNHQAPNDHRSYGAWATDAYYGDMDGVWTDNTIDTTDGDGIDSTTEGDKQVNGLLTGSHAACNAPGDGRFDQNRLTTNDVDNKNIRTAPELAVGRIDMYDLNLSGVSEVELLKRYLRKDHEYRSGAWDVRKRAIIYNNVPSNVGRSAYADFLGLFESKDVDAGYYFPTQVAADASNRSYLWGWIDGFGLDPTQFIGGDLETSDGGGAIDFLSTDTSPKVVFNQLFGSFVTNWYHPNSFFRAAIAGPGYGLTSSSIMGTGWTSQFWHMSMGETIGENTVYTQQGQPSPGVTRIDRSAALMGDPTLRMAVVKPPTDVQATVEDEFHSTVSLAWTASTDEEVLGYQVYRAASVDGPFVKISGTGYVSAASPFVDTAAFNGCVYMVRAVKLEQSNTGTYYNLSQGAFSEVQAGLAVGRGRASRAFVDSVALTFNRPVTLGPGAVVVNRRDLPPGQGNVPVSVSTGDGGLSYDVRLLDAQNNAIPFDDGVYDVRVVPGEVWLAGTTTPVYQSTQADASYMFFRLAGDANGDAGVNFADYILYQTEVQLDQTLASDSDGDGDVDDADFVLLQSRFGVTFSV